MEKLFRRFSFELWGGIECTLNRVGDQYFDQLEHTGHYRRADDIGRIASLGVSALRYPVLWEFHQPSAGAPPDFTWVGRNLLALKAAGIEPIAGLVHHGSGPAYTSLEDPLFGEKLSDYASHVARAFPWLRYFTPVNEPLTTARFSGLYGLWYPHTTDDLSFLRMLLNELRGVVLSMKEIRKVIPEAKLVQTEDLGKTYSPPVLHYQADFENERRWLTYDLLCGKVDRHHPLWNYLLWAGITERELSFFTENVCTPDIAGFNYYVTSERYLDPNIEHYPVSLHGGNRQHRYVDTEAVRINHPEPCGLAMLLREAWSRFGIPIAVTEAFMSCTEDEQVRWVDDMLRQTEAAKRDGVDIRAFTFWALLGEFSWNKLVTSMDGEYEAGVFDCRGGRVRETLLATYLRNLTGKHEQNGELSSDRFDGRGWWRREDRFHQHEHCVAGPETISGTTF